MTAFLGRVPVGIGHRHLEAVGLVALGPLFLSYSSSPLGSMLGYLAEDLGPVAFGIPTGLSQSG